jgi:hypothetical protein
LSTTCAVFFAAANLICHAQWRKFPRARSPGAGFTVLFSVAPSIAWATESVNRREAFVSITASPT